MYFITEIFAVILAVVVWKNLSPMFFMHPLPSSKIEGTDILAIKNRINNLFFCPAGENWIVIDAGSDAHSVKREMESWKIDGQKVKAVFLTHTDYDHVASLVLFPNAVIYLNAQEKQMVDGSVNRQFIKKNKLPALSGSGKVVYLSDSGTVDVNGQKVCMIQAPGHTKGSAVYKLNEKYLFTGDAFKAENGRLLVHPYTMEKRQAQETIQKLEGDLWKYEKVFTAHYGIVEKKQG